MNKRPRILLTNDDGIHASGIKHLWKSLKEFADLSVVAPEAEQSAVSHSITIRHPLKINSYHWENEVTVWSVNGTPADCVKLALNVILKESPDLILSGINRGTNSGRNAFYSGTVGAIIEGIMHDVPGIALSLCENNKPRFEQIENYIPHIVQYVLKHPLPLGTFLNINFPSTRNPIHGVRLTRQGKEYWAENPEKRHHPVEGETYYWLGSRIAEYDEHEDSDIHWLKKGYITAVPLHIGELTDHHYFSQKKENFEKVLNEKFQLG